MVFNAALLDADPYALATPDGILDLRTGLVKNPDPNMARGHRTIFRNPHNPR
jgi:hypothetical protein